MVFGHAEYDDYIEGYLAAKDRQLAFSGEASEFFARYKVEKLREWLPELADQPAVILDYGCGGGWMTRYVRDQFPRAAVTGVDASSKSIAYAREHYPDIEFTCVQSAELPFTEGTFDLALASGVIHHLPVAERRTCLDGVFRVIKPGGWFVMFEMNPFNPASVYVFKRSRFDRTAAMLLPASSRRLLSRYGRVKTKYYLFFPGFLRSLRFLEPYMAKIPFGAHYACLVRKSEARPVRNL